MKKTVNAEEAGRILDISPDTIRLWFQRGRIKAVKSKDKRGRSVLAIPVDCLTKDLFKATCILCGKVYKAKHPAKSKFCSYQHRMKWHGLKTQSYGRRGRPVKGSKPLSRDVLLKAYLKKRGVK